MALTPTTVPRVELEIVRGQARQKRRPVNVPAFLIGTSRDCDLVLGDADFPEVHAYLIVHAGGVSVRHLGFGPPLFINEQPSSRAALCDGDRLRTGPYEFIVHVGDGTPSDELPARFDAVWVLNRTSTANAQGCTFDSLIGARALLRDIRSSLRPETPPNTRIYPRSA